MRSGPGEQGVPNLSPNDGWDGLQPPRDPELDSAGVENGWSSYPNNVSPNFLSCFKNLKTNHRHDIDLPFNNAQPTLIDQLIGQNKRCKAVTRSLFDTCKGRALCGDVENKRKESQSSKQKFEEENDSL